MRAKINDIQKIMTDAHKRLVKPFNGNPPNQFMTFNTKEEMEIYEVIIIGQALVLSE